jgi:hypothetical protein
VKKRARLAQGGGDWCSYEFPQIDEGEDANPDKVQEVPEQTQASQPAARLHYTYL